MHQRIAPQKISLFFIFSALVIVIISMRLAYLQLCKNSTFFTLSQKNFLRFEKIISPRGNIVDRNYKLLATNRPLISLYWQGTGNKYLSKEQSELIELIKKHLPQCCINEDLLLQAEKLNTTACLCIDIPFERLSVLIEQCADHPNLTYKTDFKRFYPHNNVGSHIIGYLGGIHYEHTGKMGLEKMCDDVLKGKSGKLAKIVNSRGKQVTREKQKESQLGGTIVTTLDLDLSLLAEKSFPEEINGSMIIMDAQTGDILVLLSRPSFNPNIFLDPLSMETWKDIQIDQPFLNRASNACYPPSSIFKLVSIAAGLETGIINQHDTWICNGHTTFVGRDYHCWQRKGHGTMTTLSAIAQSCNIPFFEIGKKIKIDTLADYAGKLGLGQITHSILPEKTGLIPTRKWKREAKGESWWPGETLSAAIGQSFLLVTPLQVARMINGICEGFLVTPRILAHEPYIKKEVDLSTETRDFLKRSMKQSIQGHGTGSRLNRLKNFEIFAKTGTAQTSSFEKRELAKEFLEQGWFVCHVTYKDNPSFIMVILMEHVGSSSVVTAVGLDYLIRYKNYSDAKN